MNGTNADLLVNKYAVPNGKGKVQGQGGRGFLDLGVDRKRSVNHGAFFFFPSRSPNGGAVLITNNWHKLKKENKDFINSSTEIYECAT